MTILITGGAGFIGSHLADRLVQDYSTVVLDNFSTGRNENVTAFFDAGGKVEVADVRDKDVVLSLFEKYRPERVAHLAGQSAISYSLEDPLTDLEINGLGTINVLHACQMYGVKKFVFASTSAVYRENNAPKMMRESWDRYPKSPYGASKLAGELYTRQMFHNSIIMRFGNVYGPRQVALGENQLIARAMQYLTDNSQRTNFKLMRTGEQKRDFIYVKDLVEIIIRCLFADDIRTTFNAATGKPKSVNYVIREIEKIFGIVGYRWEWTKTVDTRDVGMDVSHLKKLLSWKPKWSMRKGLMETAHWWLDKNGYV